MSKLRLNLGCGDKILPGWVNVDKFGKPDIRHDLEVFPWPWPDDAVAEILMNHVLEHLGETTVLYMGIMKEMYRVCEAGAVIRIVVPHFRHDFFHADPTHVRAITPFGMQLLSQRLNREWQAAGAANSPLGLYWEVNFELLETKYKPSQDWYRLHPEPQVQVQYLLQEAALYNNLIEEIHLTLQVVK